jgi:hypothetical protein
MPIQASTNGILCLPLTDTTSGDGVWRNSDICPYSSGEAAIGSAWSWTKYGTFYIMHENTLSTWYRHADDGGEDVPDVDMGYHGLTRAIYNAIQKYGHAKVSTGSVVGYVGGAGGYHHHLDFAVRLGTVVIDPYRLNLDLPIGSGVLWQEHPPQ